MDFNDTEQEAIFRAEVKAWLKSNAPEFELPKGEHIDDAEEVRIARAWQKRKFDGGYAGIVLPKELGGRGGNIIEDVIFREEEAEYNMPIGPYVTIGLGMVLHVLSHHGTKEQIEKYFEPTLRGDLTWCQLFSEPSAGSDLANLRTKAVKDGDDWIVNGQKVWSSWAHHADFGILVVRTDPKVAKHAGLTFLILDMKTQGVEIRPIRQISGLSDFNETFLSDVRVPDENRVGEINGGWSCVMTVLTAERLNQGGKDGQGGIGAILRLAQNTKKGNGTALDSSYNRVTLASMYAQEMGEKYFQARLRTMYSRGENPGALAAIVKLAYSSRLQKSSGHGMEFLGINGIAHENDRELNRIWHDYIWATALRIAGGADQVLRNQISERVLGMPGDIRGDKGIPFDQLK